MYIVFISVLVLAILAAGITQFGYLQITQMRVKNDLSLFSILEGLGLYSHERYEALSKKEIELTSMDGLKLSGAAVETYPDSKRWIIIVHGYTGSRAVSTQFIDMFTEEGYNILLIDQRRHGRSEGRYTTYGYYEKYDIQTWVNWIVEHYGDDTEIGLHGQSLGGGTVLEYLSIAAPQVKLVIADCPYSDLADLMKHQITKLNKIPSVPFFGWVNNRIRKKCGFSFEQVSPIRAVRESHLPVMFIHGTNDTYVPTRMSKEMYEAKPGPKKLVLIEGAIHANAYHVGTEQYREATRSFLHEYIGAPIKMNAFIEPTRIEFFQDNSLETI
ncbi:alpha/beta hydrolase [Paenibacillus dakarensis]|uniref:alpha/beta hydrolase n=1 Tax=Paenibacillus dakarensis TaxID=1527293 RepID=UPI0006D58C27|nr:alpha/beta hydrolase [Paenibacillus dakarensis]